MSKLNQGTSKWRQGLVATVLCCIGLATFPASGQQEDGAASTAMVSSWIDAWNRDDAVALSNLLTDDVDFVLVSGMSLVGREAFRSLHHEQFMGRYDHSVFSLDGEPGTALIRPEVRLVQWRWTISGVRDTDGSAAPAYHGIFTWVLVKDSGQWKVRAAQNTVVR